MATLYVHIPEGGILSREVPQTQPLSIGEAPENAFPVKAVSVSARHAEIVYENGVYKLRDLGSSNKSWLNGIAVLEAGLKDGDSVRFGKVEGLFVEGSPVGGKLQAEPALRGRLTLSTPEGDTDIVQFEGTTTVGWKSDNDVRIKDPSVSGHHAQFIEVNGKYVLKDLGSTNKTYVNQEPITEVQVHDGDVVQFGAVRGNLTIHFGLRRLEGPTASDAEVKALVAQVEALKTQAEVLSKERDGLDFHNKALAAQLKDVEDQLDQIKSESAAKQKALANEEKSVESALSVAETRAAELEASLKAAKEKTEKAERELQEAKAQVEALSGDQTGQQQKIASLMQARDTLRAEKEQTASQLAQAQAKLEAETKAAAESARKQKEGASKLLEQENTIGELKAEIEALNAKANAAMAKRDETLARLQNAARDREREQSEATGEVAAAEARAAKAEKEAKEAREAAELTSRQLRDSNALIETLSGDQTGDRQQIAALTQTRDTLQQEKDRLTSHAAEAKAETEKAAKERDEAKKSLEEATARIKSLTADCEGFKSFEKSLEERIGTLTRERELAKASATDLQAQIDLLCQESDETRAAGTQLQVKLDTMVKERDAAKEAVTGLQGKLDAMTESRDEAKASGVTLQSKVEALTKERDEAKLATAELQAKLDALAKEQTAAKVSATGIQAKLEALKSESESSQASSAAQIAVLTKERDTLKNAGLEWQAKFEALARELDAVRTMAQAQTGLQTQLDQARRERDGLRTEATLSSEKLALAERQIEALTARLHAPAPAAPAAPAAPVVPAPVATPAPMPTVSMPGLSMPSVQPSAPAAPRPVPVAVPVAVPAQPAAPAGFPALPKLSLAKEQPLPAEPQADPRHSLIEIAPPAHDPGMVATRPEPIFGGGGGTPNLKKILETAPEALNSMRRSLHAFIKNQAEMSLLDEFQVGLHCMAEETRAANVTPVATLSNALEMLVDDLKKIPGQINPSSLRTVSQAVDFLVTLIHEKNLSLTKDPSLARLFAVDDDPDALKTILAALEVINLKVSSAVDARGAVEAFNKEQYDLVLIDVGLPDINGFELCTRLRKLPDYKKVPVVFITGAVTVQNRVQSSLSGGNDFIAKPFNLLELGVKALIWIFKGQIGLV